MDKYKDEIIDVALKFTKAIHNKDEELFYDLLTNDSKARVKDTGKKEALEQFAYKLTGSDLTVWEDYQFTNLDKKTEAYVKLGGLANVEGYNKILLCFEENQWKVNAGEIVKQDYPN